MLVFYLFFIIIYHMYKKGLTEQDKTPNCEFFTPLLSFFSFISRCVSGHKSSVNPIQTNSNCLGWIIFVFELNSNRTNQIH